MKKSKVILAIALAVVFIITCMNVPTFSWFTRPQGLSGNEMVLKSKNEYKAYNGYKVKIQTSESSDEGVTYTTPVNSFGKKTITPYKRNYFCTTITNESGKDQNVSLYASELSIPTQNNGTLALGVNGPTRSYRDYTNLAKQSSKTTRDLMRVYFEKNDNTNGWKDKEYYICWNDDPNTGSESLDGLGTNGTYTKLNRIYESNYYYADISKNATHAFFSVADFGTNNNGNANWGQRTQTLYNLAKDGLSQAQSVVFTLSNTEYSGENPKVFANAVHGAGIYSYYSIITVQKGSSFDAKLSAKDEAIGNITYWSGDKSVFTVNETTGKITPVAEGEAILYTKSEGPSYYDTLEVKTTVRVVNNTDNYDFADVPIVRNVLIPGDEGTDENNPANIVKIYWYVMNNSSKSLTYTIKDIYLGL